MLLEGALGNISKKSRVVAWLLEQVALILEVLIQGKEEIIVILVVVAVVVIGLLIVVITLIILIIVILLVVAALVLVVIVFGLDHLLKHGQSLLQDIVLGLE